MNTPSGDNPVVPSTGKKILRAVSLLARGIAVVVIGLLAIGLLVNLIDEKLKPETQALLAPPAYHANPAAIDSSKRSSNSGSCRIASYRFR